MMKLMKNRVSARKCRTKKKNYMQYLEEEILELKKKIDLYKSGRNINVSIEKVKLMMIVTF